MAKTQSWAWLLGTSLLALGACATPTRNAPMPTTGAADPPPAFQLAGVEGAKERLSGAKVMDFSNRLVGAAQRWAPQGLEGMALPGLGGQAAKRQLQAYGDPVVAAWAGGVALTGLGCAPGDIATNGAGVRAFTNTYPKKTFVVTRQGRFLEVDPITPLVGFQTTDLDGTAASTFTKTYVSLSSEGSVAFAVSDEGNLFAINVVGAGHAIKHLALGKACVGAALFHDPLASGYNNPYVRAYLVANDGTTYRITYTPGANFAASTFTAVPVGLATAITAPFTGTAKVSSPAVALGGKVYVGDRGGFFNELDTNTGVLRSFPLSSGWPVESPPAIDVDNSLNATDAWVTSGARCYWIRVASGEVLESQNLLAENKGTFHGSMNSGTVATWLNTSTAAPYRTATTGNSAAFSLYRHNTTDVVTIPGDTVAPLYRDDDRLTHSGFMTGQPPQIDAFVGPAGRPFNNFDAFTYGSPPTYPAAANKDPIVPDGTLATAAQLQGPVAVDVMDDGTLYPDDDGSVFIADTQHCNILFKPATAASGLKWATAGVLAGTLDPTRVYTFAGSMNLDGVMNGGDIGNGAGGAISVRPARLAAGVVARNTPINLSFGIAVGNLGLYIAQLNKNTNGALQDGAILFIPRVGVTAAWGMTGLEAGKMYVLSTACNPLGMCCDRRVAGQDRIYVANYGDRASTNNNRIMTMLSTSGADLSVAVGDGTRANTADGTLASAAKLNRPTDVSLDDMGNILMSESVGNRLSMIWVGGAGNTRTWGIASPVAGHYYRIATVNTAQTCTFAVNDPQVPTGCIYTSSGPSNRVERVDSSGTVQAVAGDGTAGNTGDGGPSNVARVNAAYGARGDGQGTTYVADRFNNRIRVMTSRPDSGQSASYMRFDLGAAAGRPVYAATLNLTSITNAGSLTVPSVGIASPYLKNTYTVWDAANARPTLAPAINLASGLATPSAPTTATYTNGGTYSYTLPASVIPYGTAPHLASVFVGASTPVDANQYYYPTGVGLPTGSVRSPEFNSRGATRPSLTLTTGDVPLKRSILAPPAIALVGGVRVIMVANANALWRMRAEVSSPTDFTSSADLTLTEAGRAAANGTRYIHDNQFQPNPTPPLLDETGIAHVLDLRAPTSATQYTYTLNRMNGASATTDMHTGSFKVLGTNLSSALNDNAGIYLAGGSFTIDEAYLGLGDGKLYRVTLRP